MVDYILIEDFSFSSIIWVLILVLGNFVIFYVCKPSELKLLYIFF